MAEVEVFDPSLKKKKKKTTKKPSELEEAGTDGPKDEPAPEDSEMAPVSAVADEIDFSKMKKPKAKPKTAPVEEQAATDGKDVTDSGLLPWTWDYDQLLNRVYNIMREKNPGFDSGEKKKIIMKPPQCARVGSKKTCFANFAEICRILKRQPKHVLQFLLAELGTSGSMDGNNQLIVKGRFQQKQFEAVLKNYIREYVSCHTCRAAETVLEKDGRLFFLKCEVCGSRCSVVAIKTGFQAVTTKRAKTRAAAGQ